MFRAVVVVFCGPHTDEGGVLFHRIDRAIRVCTGHGVPLLIAGDGNGGRDVELFTRRALEAGVESVIPLGVSISTTLDDADRVASKLQETEFVGVRQVCLVTDDWHMPRAVVMLADRLKSVRGKMDVEIICENVSQGPPPPRWVTTFAEQRGLQDFISGRYTPARAVHPAWGKPAVREAGDEAR